MSKIDPWRPNAIHLIVVVVVALLVRGFWQ